MNVDLNDLRIDHPQAAAPSRGASRVWMLLFFALLITSGGAIGWLWQHPPGDGRVAVRVAKVRMTGDDAGAKAAFSAAGWIKLPLSWPVHVTPLIGGRLEEVTVVEGDPITAGQVLARLYEGDLAAELLAAEARLQAAVAEHTKATTGYRPQEVAEAKAEVERLAAEHETAREVLAHSRELQPGGAISLEELQRDETSVRTLGASLEKARERHALMDEGYRAEDIALAAAELEEADALRDLAQLRLGYAVITSPIAGVVLERFGRQGQWVTPSQGAIVSLFDPTDLEARVDVNQDDLAAVFLGQEVRITTRAEPGREHAGKVLLIEPQADLVKNTVPVRVAIAPEEGRTLYPDMVVTARFLPAGEPTREGGAGAPRRLVVPLTAVHEDGPGHVVWVVRNGAVERRLVKLGALENGYHEVVDGLRPGDLVVTGSDGALLQGTEVSVAK